MWEILYQEFIPCNIRGVIWEINAVNTVEIVEPSVERGSPQTEMREPILETNPMKAMAITIIHHKKLYAPWDQQYISSLSIMFFYLKKKN